MLIHEAGLKQFEPLSGILQTRFFSFSELFNLYSFGATVENCKNVKIKINEFSHALFVCGDGKYGKLGISEFYNKQCMEPTRVQSVTGIFDIAAFNEHTMMIDNSGRVWVFGCGDDGRLGTGNAQNVKVPQKISLSHRAIAVSVGSEHSMILIETGLVLSCGSDCNGQLGLGNTFSQSVPKVIESLKEHKITQISAGAYHNGALSENGDLFMWGWNSYGQCGVGKDKGETIITPTMIKLEDKVSVIDCGYNHSLLITIGNLLYSFGRGDNGKLGHGTMENKYVPTLVEPFKHVKVKNVACGFSHSLCLDEEFNVWAFGSNGIAQCAHSKDTYMQTTPKKIEYFVANKIKAKEVAAGAYSSCVIGQNNECFVFGRNTLYQIGLKEKKNYFIPTKLPLQVQKASMGPHYSVFFVDNNSDEFILQNGQEKCVKNDSNSFNISIQSKSLFGDSNWYFLDNSSIHSSPSPFINGLRIVQNEFICFDSKTKVDLSQLIGCEFLLLSSSNKNEKMFELKAIDVEKGKYGKDFEIYSFAKEDKLQNIKWKIPKMEKFEMMNVYVKPFKFQSFVFLKSF